MAEINFEFVQPGPPGKGVQGSSGGERVEDEKFVRRRSGRSGTTGDRWKSDEFSRPLSQSDSGTKGASRGKRSTSISLVDHLPFDSTRFRAI